VTPLNLAEAQRLRKGINRFEISEYIKKMRTWCDKHYSRKEINNGRRTSSKLICYENENCPIFNAGLCRITGNNTITTPRQWYVPGFGRKMRDDILIRSVPERQGQSDRRPLLMLSPSNTYDLT